MAYIEIVEIDAAGLSACGLAVLRAALIHAREHWEIKTHEVALADFCILAGAGNVSGEVMRLLLQKVQKVLVCVTVLDTDAIGDESSTFDSTQILGLVHADDSNVVFEVNRYVLGDNILTRLLNLKLRRRNCDKFGDNLIVR